MRQQQSNSTYERMHQYFTILMMIQSLQNLRARKFPITFGYALINVLIYLYNKIFTRHNQALRQDFLQHFSLSLRNIDEKRYHTMITYSLTHENLYDLATNLITAISFGKSIEYKFGPKVLIHVLGLGSVLGSFGFQKELRRYRDYYSHFLGGSQAIVALLTFYILNFPKDRIQIPFFTLPSWMVGIAIILQNKLQNNDMNYGGIIAGILYFIMRKSIIKNDGVYRVYCFLKYNMGMKSII